MVTQSQIRLKPLSTYACILGGRIWRVPGPTENGLTANKGSMQTDQPSLDSAPGIWQPPGFSLFPRKSDEIRRKDLEMLT